MTKEELYRNIAKMESGMSDGERMAAYFSGKEADCQPYMLIAGDGLFAKMWGYDLEKLNDFETKCEIIQRKKEEYGMAGIGVQMTLRTLGEALGSVVHYPKESTEYITDHFMKDYSQLAELEALDVKTNPLMKGIVEEGKRLKERFPDMPISSGCPGPMSAAASVRAVELLLRDVRRNTDNLHRLLDLCVTKCLEWFQYVNDELGVNSAMLFDPVTSTDVLGIKYFEDISRPHFKRLFDGMTEIAGAKPTVHICGHTKKLWGALAEMGVEMFSLDDREKLEEAKAMVGDRMTLIGNVSPVDVIRNGTIDEVIHEVKSQLRLAADSPRGYVVSSGCEVPLAAPKENFDAFIYAVRKYGAGARIGCLPKGLEEQGHL